MTTDPPQFLECCAINRHGGRTHLDTQSLAGWSPEQGILWIHIDISDDASSAWLRNESGLEEWVIDTMLTVETRPRSFVTDKGLLAILRGVNMNPGEDPEDMVSIRLWIESNRIISTRRRRLLSVKDLTDALDRNKGPVSSGAFLTALIGRLADRIGDFVNNIEDRIAEAEDQMGELNDTEFRQAIATLRRQIASVRRFLAPQRDALDRLYRQPGEWLSRTEVNELRDEADRVTRYLEDLDLARERAMVLREEFLGMLAQEQNARMYVLSVVAAIFLPLTFITGLLGMNVGGLPGLDNPRGFLGSVAVMLLAAGALFALFRWKKWF